MDRRELLKMVAVLTGGAVIGGDVFLSGCKSNAAASGLSFSTENIALLNEVAETIIPATNTPGAKAAKVGEFMKVIVTDCYDEPSQKVFAEGMNGLNEACKKTTGKSFMDATPEQRKTFLVSLEPIAKEYNKQRDEKQKEAKDKAKAAMDPNFVSAPSHYYSMLKQLSIWGYFSSEIGSKEALRFDPIPGKYDGAYPYKKGDKAWAI